MTELEIKRQANELLHKGQYADAIAKYEALLSQMKKPNPAIMNLIGDLYVKQGNYEKAFESFISASRTYADEGLFHNGIAVGKKVLRLDKDQVEMYGMLGQLYARQGLGMDCVKFLNEYVRRKEEAGEYPVALASYAEACEILTELPDVHAIYGEMLEQVDRREDAAVAFEKASAAYAKKEMQQEAEQWRGRAIKLRGGASPGEEGDVQDLMSLRTLRESSGEILQPKIDQPWTLFDPRTNPDIPPPPPLPPAGAPGPAAAPEAEPEVEIVSASGGGLELPGLDLEPDVDSPAVEAPTASAAEAPAIERPSEDGTPEDDSLEIDDLAGFFQSGGATAEPAVEAAVPPPESEHAVIVGDDFELVREGGDVQEVINDFREATTELLDLDDHQAHYDLGTTYMEMELFEEAAAEFEIAARGRDFILASQEMLGYCFLRNGQIDLAILELEKGLAVEGSDDRDKLGLLYNLGVASRVLDKEEEAIGYFRRILEIDPEFRDAKTRLERLVGNSA